MDRIKKINVLDSECPGFPFDVDPMMHNDAMNRCYDMDGEEFELVLKPEVVSWFQNSEIDFQYSVYFGIIYFISEEDKVKFILKWL